jgi:hypothetical protein
MTYSKALGSTQSRPSTFKRVARGLGDIDLGAKVRIANPRRIRVRASTALGSTQSRPSTFKRVARGGFGSLGDVTDAQPPTSLAQQSLAAPTIVDPTLQWQQSMLEQTTAIAAAQAEFTRRESLQRWFQIGATLAIPLSAAIWRAIFKGGRGSQRDYE